MKTLLLLLIVFPFVGSTQTVHAVDTTKYSIHLPDYWKPGNKVWKILDEKLPVVSEELKNKQLCGDNCRPKYSIEFEMSGPEILDYFTNHISTGTSTDTWEFVTLYAFSSSLLLLNEKDELITRFILVDKNEIWRVMHKAILPSYTTPAPLKIYVLRDPLRNQMYNDMARDQQQRVANNTGPNPGQSPYAYINSNKDQLSPTRRDMLNVIDEKIRSW